MRKILLITPLLLLLLPIGCFKEHSNKPIQSKNASYTHGKQYVFNLAEEKLDKFLDDYPHSLERKIIVKNKLGVNTDYLKCSPEKFLSYKIINEETINEDLTDNYVVLQSRIPVVLYYQGYTKRYIFIIRFEPLHLSDPDHITQEAINTFWLWSIKWEQKT